MPDLLAAAMACAIELTGLSEPSDMPVWIEREPTAEERATHGAPSARALYIWTRVPAVIISPADFGLLVHEATHHLQSRAGLPQNEQQAERADELAHLCVTGQTIPPFWLR